jgi:Flp pilus assembly protein TadG
MMRALRFLWQDESGSNLVETALVLPLYLMVLFVLTSFAIVFFALCNATYAAKAAVRYAVVHSTTSFTLCTSTSCTTTAIQNLITPYLLGAPSGGVTITPTWTPANTVGSTISITVKMLYPTGMPYGYLSNLVVTSTAQGTILY